MTSIRILSTEDVRRAVTMADAIALMRDAFAELSSGSAIVPQRLRLDMPQEKSLALIMPVHSPLRKKYGVKIVSLSENNPSKGLPFIHGLMMVFDADTGIPLGLMNAERITALRTGAASGLATDLLSRKDAEIAVIFGAGTQARTQLEGVAAVRRLKRAFVYSVEVDEARKFAEETSISLGIPVIAAKSPNVVSEADIICTATTSKTPVFRNEDLKPGVHINGIGSYKPDTREIPAETIKRGTVVVDSRESCLLEAGDLIIPINEGLINSEHIRAELGEIVLGKHAARSSPDEVTIFKSVGNAIQDLAVAVIVLELAEKENLGTIVEI